VRTFSMNNDVWIGLDDLTTEGTFRWVTGAPLGYEHFEGSEPNDAGVEDCTYLHASDGLWNDTNCGDQRPAVCECEVGYTPPATPVCRGKPGFVTHDGRKYFIHEGVGSAKNWADAEADCETTGAHLAVFADNEEDDPIDKEFIGESWIGLSDTATEGLFKWVDGTPLGFIHWNGTSPHGASTVRSCVRVDVDWEDQDCTLLKEYACECEP
jgi:Lectin C-type domain